MTPVTFPLLHRLGTQPVKTDLGLYIHIPFCRRRCHFCAFYLQIHQEPRVKNFLMALEQELTLYADKGGMSERPVSTIYIGGGTPTSLAIDQLHRILAAVKNRFTLKSHLEITVEASPDTVTQDCLCMLVEIGVNRISFGAQSFEESEWERLGRLGRVDTVLNAVHLARAAGFENINLDLMHGLPGQTLESWSRTLRQALELKPTHLSCYALTLEEGTRFHVDRHRGDLLIGDSDLGNEMEDLAVSYLGRAGYQRYEISNFSRLEFECRHNLRYWLSQDYLGFGPSAQSYVAGIRFGNLEDLNGYCGSLKNRNLPLTHVELLTKRQIDRERVVFGLRLIAGLELSMVDELVHDNCWKSAVDRLIRHGLLFEGKTRLQLTEAGRRFVDSVAIELL